MTGITLIALVITIVILLILAGVTMMYVMRDNSIFKRVQEAKDRTDQAIQDEQTYFNQITDSMNEYANGSGTKSPSYNENKKSKSTTTFNRNDTDKIQNANRK